MSVVKVRLDVKVEGTSRPLTQRYELPENRPLLLLYGLNVPGSRAQEDLWGTEIGCLFRYEGGVGYFPLYENAEVKMELPRDYEVKVPGVTIRIRCTQEGRSEKSRVKIARRL